MYIKDINGYDVHITTSKRHNGRIVCSAQFGTLKQENGWNSFECGIFTDPSITLAESAPNTRATEKALKEIHAAGLAKFEALKAAGELPRREAAEEVKPGQIIFFDSNYPGRDRLAVYEIVSRDSFKVVDLDTLELSTAQHVKPYSKKFGIGYYYNQGDTVPMEEVTAAVEAAKVRAAEIAEERRKIEADLKAEKAAKIAAGKEILPAMPEGATHVIVAKLREDKSDPQSDYFGYETKETIFLMFSRHGRNLFDEMRKAAALSPDPEINQYSQPDSKNEHRENYSGGNGYYLGRSKYSGWIIEKDNLQTSPGSYGITLETLQIAAAEGRLIAPQEMEQAPAANIAPVETLPDTVNIIDYSEKAIAVVGDTRPIKDRLKAAGGKFNFRLSCGPGWIFSKSRLQAVTNLLKEIQPQQDPGERTEEQEQALQEVEEAAADLLTEAEGFGAMAE